VKSIRLQQQDRLEHELTLNPATIHGNVRDRDGNALPYSVVTLVPETQTPGRTRWLPITAADDNGTFVIRGIAPGTYRLHAWEEIENSAHWDPIFMQLFASGGERVTVEEGSVETLTIERISAAEMARTLQAGGLR
jgi:hypothetical protein